jgi:hypothetical protein
MRQLMDDRAVPTPDVRLEIDVTIDDPKAYTAPFTVRVNQRLMLDTELIEFICGENQKFVEFLLNQKVK